MLQLYISASRQDVRERRQYLPALGTCLIMLCACGQASVDEQEGKPRGDKGASLGQDETAEASVGEQGGKLATEQAACPGQDEGNEKWVTVCYLSRTMGVSPEAAQILLREGATPGACEAVCGDGAENQPSEQCDDGNRRDDDGCNNACQITPICGDGVVNQAYEQCDDGNRNNRDGCDRQCMIVPPRCGDGIVNQPSEQCDDGNRSNGDCCLNRCRIAQSPRCRSAVCGDRIVQAGEECDDGNSINADDCSNVCVLPKCGDGIVQADEECDGSSVNGDACAEDCTIVSPPPRCGDGKVTAPEECDDGNTDDHDDCTTACTLSVCGDGIVQAPEQCDDANGVNDDGCSNTCQSGVGPRCGDGIVNQAGEQCDDANGVNDDACSDTCQLARCGDGIVQAPEQCDDGNRVAGDGCESDCTNSPLAGDLAHELPACRACRAETCANYQGAFDLVTACFADPDPEFVQQCVDLKNCAYASGCGYNGTGPVECFCGSADVNACQNPGAANGPCKAEFFAAARTNQVSELLGSFYDVGLPIGVATFFLSCDYESCNEACELPRCGDGVRHQNEQCDDGNAVDDDGCSNHCLMARCGDGILQAGEQCDDGNAIAGDGCETDCRTTPVGGDKANQLAACRSCRAAGCTNFQGLDFDFVAACFQDPDPTFVQQCIDVKNCAYTNKCGYDSNGLFECFCGTADASACQTAGAANGPCRTEIFAAVRSTQLADVIGNFGDISLPIGVATYFTQCDVESCPSCVP